MLRTSRPDGVNGYSVTKTYHANSNPAPAAATAAAPNYDSSSFAPVTDEQSRFHMELVSRLSQEVRTATTTGKIQELRQAVLNNEYVPDPSEIAKRILLLVED